MGNDRKPIAQTRVEPRTKEQVKEYQDKNDLATQSEAARRLIKIGLIKKGHPPEWLAEFTESESHWQRLKYKIKFWQ